MRYLIILIGVFCLLGCGKEDKNEKMLKDIKKTLEARKVDLSVKIDPAAAEGVNVPEETKNICESFLSKFVKEDFSGAFQEIRKHSALPEKEIVQIETLTKQQIKIVKPRFGDLIGYELIKTNRISNSLIKFTYIVKTENHALRWTFIFYKAKEKWVLNYFHWDDKIQLL